MTSAEYSIMDPSNGIKIVYCLIESFSCFLNILEDVTIVAVAMIIIAITVIRGNSGTVGEGAGEF
jgi:hypothetical protein